jgi:3-oxoacyl-[acyl-carrier-protein] synthase III
MDSHETGIAERRISDKNTASSDLAYEAAQRALKDRIWRRGKLN